MVMMATSSRESGCWDSLGCPCGIVFERDPGSGHKNRAVWTVSPQGAGPESRGRARFASEEGAPNEDRTDPLPSKPHVKLAL